MIKLQYSDKLKSIRVSDLRFLAPYYQKKLNEINFENHGYKLTLDKVFSKNLQDYSFIFDDPGSEIWVNEYQLGNVLLDFIYMDMDELINIAKGFDKIGFPKDMEGFHKNVEFMETSFEKMVNIHPYFESLYIEFDSFLMDYRLICHSYIGESIGPEASQVINRTIENLRRLLSYQSGSLRISGNKIRPSLLKEYIDFCFINNQYEEFENLSSLSKFKIYDTLKDGELSQRLLKSRLIPLEKKPPEKIDLSSAEDRDRIYNIINDSNDFPIEYYVSTDEALVLELSLILTNSITIKQCGNCGKYFIPDNREDEIYCSRINTSGKTCKQLGWDNKEKRREYTEYRKVSNLCIKYKKRNKEKFKSNGLLIEMDTLIEAWKNAALHKKINIEILETTDPEYQALLDDYIKWLEYSYKQIQIITKGGYSEEEETLLNSGDKRDIEKWFKSKGGKK